VSPRGRALVAALLALAAGCAEGRGEGRHGARALAASAAPERSEAPAGTEAPAASASAAPSADDPVARELLDARIVTLTPMSDAHAPEGTLAASLEGASSASRHVAALSFATDSTALAYRRPLAFYRLAAALGAHVVPAAAARRISVGELGALLEADPKVLGRVRREARVQNDGTVDALLTAPLPSCLATPWERPRALSIDPVASAEVHAWERWASSPAPSPDERPRLLRDFVEALVLDYLAAVEVRPALLFLPDEGALVLDENRGAFSQHPDPEVIAKLLRRLRAVARFPRGLRDALVQLDRPRAAAILAPAGFDTWLVPPRSLLELDERRASLLTLLEAQIEARGAESVLCL
jgi:hypothetical protein